VLWVYFIVALGLLGIMVEIWMSFRKQTEELREDRERVRAGIRQHESAIADLEQRRKQAEAEITELTGERDGYKGEVELKTQELDELLQRWRQHNVGDPFDPDPGRI
jgi:chromosome segregation ATPase